MLQVGWSETGAGTLPRGHTSLDSGSGVEPLTAFHCLSLDLLHMRSNPIGLESIFSNALVASVDPLMGDVY